MAERDLVDTAIGTDPAARQAVGIRYRPAVDTQLTRLLGPSAPIAEIADEVFDRFWTNATRFDLERATVGAVLQMLATGKALEWIRSEAARRTPGESYAPQPVRESAGVSEIVWAVESLPHPERRAVWLAGQVGFNYRQVAIALDVTEGSVKADLRTGLRRLHHLAGLSEVDGARPTLRDDEPGKSSVNPVTGDR